MVLFSYKNRPPGFSSTTTLIGPSVLGLTEVYKWYSSRSSYIAQLQASVSGLLGTRPCSLLHRCQEMVSVLCVFNKQARGTQVQVWCPLASQSATKSSHLGLQRVLLLLKSFHFFFFFFPPLGSRAAMLKGIFCALPEQV